jgi:protein-S-isoprenylcysteine O-methyltransferase Ste14
VSTLTFVLRSLAIPAVIGGIICVSAGRWDLPFVWGVLGVLVTFYLLLAAFADPDLLRERQAPGPGNQDRLTRFLGGPLLLSSWIVTGLDVGRLQLTPIRWELQAVGLIGYAAALGVNFWAMLANRYYSSVVRVQADRGQHVVASGPYRIVRHPGYAATLFAMMSGGVALGSWLGLIPVLAFAALFVRRTLVEDRLLLRELAGYADYAGRVRYRLVPGLF